MPSYEWDFMEKKNHYVLAELIGTQVVPVAIFSSFYDAKDYVRKNHEILLMEDDDDSSSPAADIMTVDLRQFMIEYR